MTVYMPTHPHLVKVNFGEPTATSSYTSSLSTVRSVKKGEVVIRLLGAPSYDVSNSHVNGSTNGGSATADAAQDTGFITSTTTKRYTSVQVSADDHIELNSDFVYMNHSCDPSVDVITHPGASTEASGRKWSGHIDVVARRDLAPGDELTFFYPNTEWEMDQPFDCFCAAASSQKKAGGDAGGKCLGKIAGAKFLSQDVLVFGEHGTVNSHILELKRSQR